MERIFEDADPENIRFFGLFDPDPDPNDNKNL